MSIKKTDVLGNLVYASVSMSCASEIPGYNGTLFAISEETKERIEVDLVAARAAVAELIEANRELLIEWDRQDNGMFDVMPAKDWAVAEARFRAALANVGSAS